MTDDLEVKVLIARTLGEGAEHYRRSARKLQELAAFRRGVVASNVARSGGSTLEGLVEAIAGDELLDALRTACVLLEMRAGELEAASKPPEAEAG